MNNTSTARRLSAFAGIALVLGLTACAPGNTQGNELKTDSKQMSMVDWRQKTDDCMKAAGFDISTASAGEGGMTGSIDMSQFDMEAFDMAYKKCAETVGEPPVDENQPTEAEMFESQLAFASCMRDAGYDYPDPVKGNPMTSAMGPEIDVKVVDACSAKANGQETGK
ncbi:hypothetical protein ACFY5D_08485 [Paeniglutamicibacter sp. NPDC012692]|uniref:hypothetical protein n=1 Tax=Paeniglutamicibacter sp. NPDC012692 TaxID=3364388 RepID=UPI00368B7927